MSSARSAGNRGEAEVARYLRKKGYTLMASQWRCRFGELDLVAKSKKGVICFVEVKLRSNLDFGLPREFVTPAKQRRIRATAGMYMSVNELDCPVRFDVAEVYTDADYDPKSMRIEYLEDAF